MLKEYELNQAYELIQEYHKEEETFKRKLLDKEFAQELLDEMSSFKPESEIQINLKLQWQSSDDTTVKEFHDILNDAFSSFTRYIHLLEVKRGCVYCVCRAPRLLEEVLVKLGREGVERLKGRGVGLLVIGDIVILDETDKKEEEKENRPVSVNTNVRERERGIKFIIFYFFVGRDNSTAHDADGYHGNASTTPTGSNRPTF